MPTINSLAPWFGSKRTLAPQIVDAIGPGCHVDGMLPIASLCAKTKPPDLRREKVGRLAVAALG